MANVRCPACIKEISELASNCPYCRAEIPADMKPAKPVKRRAGKYPDPENPGMMRNWNGSNWTGKPYWAAEAGGPSLEAWWVTGVLFAIAGVIAVAVGADKDNALATLGGWLAVALGSTLLMVATVATGMDLALRMQEYRNKPKD